MTIPVKIIRESVFLLAVLMLAAAPAAAQTERKHLHNVAVGTYRQNADSTTTANFALGIMAYSDTLRGLSLNLFSSTNGRSMQGASLSGFVTATVGNASGLQFSPVSNSAGGMMRGAQLSLLSNYARSLSGVQAAGIYNISSSPVNGLQLSAVTNISYGIKRGMQFASLANISSGEMRGLQAGTYNYADTLTGCQIGLLNLSGAHSGGTQIGVINYSRDTAPRQIGLVGIDALTSIDIMTFAGNTSLSNIAVRFRNGHTYTSLGSGYFYAGMSHHFSGELSYRVGHIFDLSRRWSVTADLGISHIESFEGYTNEHPRRLFAIEARAGAEYRINSWLGISAAAGYSDARSYHHASPYRRRLLLQGGLIFHWHRSGSLFTLAPDTMLHSCTSPDSMALWNGGRRNYFLPAIETAALNALVNGVDRLAGHDYAKISLHSIKNNFRHGFVWDNDNFSTNLFAHPYHGSLYFNSARSNGLSFWRSIPYALCGSLMWEFCGETEPPAINDVMATTIGGSALGEVSHRLSELVLNDRSRGFRRFLREAAATLLNPMGGLNRIISGDVRRVRSDHFLYYDKKRFPIDFSVSAGSRYLSDDGALFRGEFNPYINIFLEYGDPIHADGTKPYDFFYLETTLGLSANQPLINRVHLIGRIWGKNLETNGEMELSAGIFQHFNYYDSKPVKDGTQLTPYRISEAASFGPGIIMNLPSKGVLTRLEQRLFLSAILLGGTKSDYYNVIDRDYNMGSGFSVKSKTHMEFRNFGRFILHTNYYYIVTWKGYEHKDLEDINLLYLNAQGDKSHAALAEITPMWELDFHGPLSATMAASYFMRSTHYSYRKNVRANTFEIKMGLTYHF